MDTYPHCGGRMKLRALVRDPESIERFLRQPAVLLSGIFASPLVTHECPIYGCCQLGPIPGCSYPLAPASAPTRGAQFQTGSGASKLGRTTRHPVAPLP